MEALKVAKPRSDRPFSRGTVSSLKCGAVVFSVASEERKVPIDTRHQTANLPSSTILPQTAKPPPHFFKHCVFETSRNDNVRCSTLVRNAFETSLQSLITATACSVPPPIMATAMATEFKLRNQSPSSCNHCTQQLLAQCHQRIMAIALTTEFKPLNQSPRS